MTDSKTVFLADMQSFYASVEKAAHPEFRDRPVIVAGDPERRAGIVLAACPIAKRYGVKTAEWIRDAVGKCPDLIVIRPHMQLYIDVSLQITEILERYSDLVEPYSIDEQFLDVTGTARLFGGPEKLAAEIQQTIWAETRIRARVGMGPNKVLAKMCCDNFAKKNESGIDWLGPDNLQERLWPLPVGDMFMVGGRMKRHFARLGLHSIGDVAQTPLEPFKRKMRLVFGKDSDIQAEVYWMTANGIDYSPVTPGSHDRQKAIGHHTTLPRDYHTFPELKVVLLELCEEVCRRARFKGLMGETVSVSCRGADFDAPTGFHRQRKLADPTHHAADLYGAVCELFQAHWDGLPVRSVGVALHQLSPDETFQLNLFRDVEKERRLDSAIDAIKDKFGSAAIVRAVSRTEAGQAHERARKIGGHYK